MRARLEAAAAALPPRVDLKRLYELLAKLDYPNAPSEQERIVILEEAIQVAGQDERALNLVRPYLPAPES
jgi:hypothetical protein